MRREERDPDEALVTPDIEALADAVRGRGTAAREAEALAAFCRAHDAGTPARAGRSRRRDDWRPAAGRRSAGTPWKAALGAVVASAALGGVAMAVGVVPVPFDRDPGPAPTVDAPRGPAGPPAVVPVPGTTQEWRPQPAAPSASAHGPADPGLVGLCRARSAGGGAGSDQASGRLAEAAGGQDGVDEFCDRALEESGAGGPSKSAKPSPSVKPSKSAKPPKSAKPSKSPKSANPPKSAKLSKEAKAAKSPEPSKSPKAARTTKAAEPAGTA
ncbi:hypothetical protein OG524_01720 [Streptomyces sp. NBC_01520]|uniref:hypothetical protein n=1 Tax=Streptomyces sp. NBC_01520 TaxID=2903892 RepID=UPI00386878E9